MLKLLGPWQLLEMTRYILFKGMSLWGKMIMTMVYTFLSPQSVMGSWKGITSLQCDTPQWISPGMPLQPNVIWEGKPVRGGGSLGPTSSLTHPPSAPHPVL